MAHVKDFNIFQCIYAVLLFGEASSNGGLKYKHEEKTISQIEQEKRQINAPARRPVRGSTKGGSGGRRAGSGASSPNADRKLKDHHQPRSEDEIEFSENTGNIYDAISLQLLDLMYALHTSAGKILGEYSRLSLGSTKGF